MKQQKAQFLSCTINSAMLLVVAFLPSIAFAQDSGNELMNTIIGHTSALPNFFMRVIAYLLGLGFAISGLVGIKNANESGGRIPIKNPLFRLLIGGFFLSLGATLNYLVETVEVPTANTVGAPMDPGMAANTLGGLIQNSMSNIGLLPAFVSMIAYSSAIYFAITAFMMLQDYIEDPSKNELSKVFKRLFGAGFLLTLPTITGVIINTFGGNSAQTGVCFNSAGTGGADCSMWSVEGVLGAGTPTDGFDAVLANIVDNMGPAFMQYGLPAFCYFAGTILVAVCLYRLAQASSDASRAPGSFGTFTTLIVGAALLSLAHMIAFTRGSLFNTGDVHNQMQFVTTSPVDPLLQERAERAATAVLIFLRIVGYISFARGLFIFRAFGEGRQGGSILGAVTHIIAGGLLANLGMLLEMVQNTTGIEVFQF